MKSKKNLLKVTSIFLISLLIASSIIMTVNANTNNYYYGEGNNREEIVWDNEMNYDGLWNAQYDGADDYDAYPADDFIFSVDSLVDKVRWIGGYWSDPPSDGDFDWQVIFYNDRGDGDAPGEVIETYFFPNSAVGEVFIEEILYARYYDYEVDLPDSILFTGGEKYWITIHGLGNRPPSSGWGYHEDPIQLHMAVFLSEYFGYFDWTNIEIAMGSAADMCFQLIAAPQPDLDCDGDLSWSNVEPGDVVTGSFEIENIGEQGSLLDWEITDYPDWGTWIFDPDEGEDLTPEHGAITIDVTVIAPDTQDETFTGEVTITNSEDSGDFCIIDVSLVTPVKQQEYTHPLLQMILERFPNEFPMLRHLLGQ